MKYLDFEKHIKNELESAKEPVQMDALLSSLNLGKKPTKPKGFAFWLIIPFLILALSVIAWKFVDTSDYSDNAALSENSSIDNNAQKETLNAEPILGQEIAPTNMNEDKDNESELKLTNKENIKSTSKINSNSTKKSTNRFKLTTLNNGIPAVIEDKQKFKSQNSNRVINSNLISNIRNNENSGTYIRSSNNSTSEANTKQYGNSNTNSIAKLDANLVRNAISIATLDESIELLDDNEIDGNLFSRMKINCPSFDNAGWHMALIPEVGVFHPNKTLKDGSLGESSAFNERLRSEKTLEGIELGLYGMLVRDHVPFYIKAGLSYSRISERMDLKYEYVEKDTTLGIISTTVSGNGDTITHIYGDIVTETTFKGSNRQHYYIHLFDVPIAIGYSTYLAGLDIGIEGGVKINFMTRATGNLLTSRKDYTNVSLNRLFKNRIGLSYFGGLMIGRNFGRFGDFYVAPRFTYFPNEFNNQNNAISQKYFSVGLNVGMVYKI